VHPQPSLFNYTNVTGSIPEEFIIFFANLHNPSSRTMALGLTASAPENLSEGKARSARKVDNLIVICESNVYKMWDPRHLTTP
jgi:hypothetical protein